MLRKSRTYYFITIVLLLHTMIGNAQYGPPVFLQDFGEGTSDPNTISPALPPGMTGFAYAAQLCPPDQSYTLVRRVPVTSCFNNEWFLVSRDDSPSDFGNLMLVNHAPHPNTEILLYVDTIRNPMCAGTDYLFSFAGTGVDNSVPCNPVPTHTVFIMNVENEMGTVLFSDTTFPLGFPGSFMFQYGLFSLPFTMPAMTGRLVIRIKVRPSSADCGEDFGIDDVQVRPMGPDTRINFQNESPFNIIKSVCFQDNRTITMEGVMDPFYNVPLLQWQVSSDDGLTWADIPGATNNTYSNTFSVADTFKYRLTGGEAINMSNVYCRVASNIITVNVDGLPTIYDAISNSPVCSGKELRLQAESEAGATYLWWGPNGFWDNVRTTGIGETMLSDSGWYYAQFITQGGCRVTDSTYVTIIGTDVEAWPDTAICKGESVVLHVNPGTSYEWTPAAGLSSTTISNPRATPEATTIYTVKLTDQYGCSDTARVEVRIINDVAIKARIDGTGFLCRTIDSASFTDASDGNITRWNWDFGDGQTSTVKTPPMLYYNIPASVNHYTITLAVADADGCADTAYKLVEVAKNCYIAVPSAFTPNSDGLNDYLYPLNAYKATDLLFRVYNRQGQVMFETRDWTRKWDGRLNGSPQGTGVYVWVLTYTDATRKRVFLNGTTVLIR
jgi:gliding motility-associated-like protein